MPHRRAIDWTYGDLLALLKNGEQENLMLDYKASLAIGEWTDTRRNELAKDICAFANSAGGIIIIGVGELEHKPVLLDDGVDTARVSKEAVESALMARIAPRIDSLTIKEIPNPHRPNFAYFVIGIPRSMRAPHMCTSFHRYYKRYNFECVPMEHYEVEDVRRRQSEPALVFTCELQAAGSAFTDGRQPFALSAGVQNEGSVMATDVLVRLYIPRQYIGQITWSPNDSHEATSYQGMEVYRFDYYVRDNAGPIPIYPRDDQPFLITRGKSRRIILHLPPRSSPELVKAQLIAQIFAEGMRVRQFEITLNNLFGGAEKKSEG